MVVRYVYKARALRVIDGDTFVIEIDQGLRATRQERIRCFGIDCPECKGETREQGERARDFARKWLFLDEGPRPICVETFKSDSFGRWLGQVWDADTDECLNDLLVSEGHAKYRAYGLREVFSKIGA